MSRKLNLLIAGASTAFVMVLMLGVGLTIALKAFVVAPADQSLAPAADTTITAPVQVPAVNPPASQPASVSNTMTTRLSPAQALIITAGAVRNAQLLRAPELVSYQGNAAYQMALSQGTVYVDAATGKILYNGAATQQQPSQVRRAESHSEGEHDD